MTSSANTQLRDRYARWSYDRLLVMQPHIEVSGLYKSQSFFVAVVANCENLTADNGESLLNWFHNNKALTSPIRIDSKIPTDGIQIFCRSEYELADLTGEPLTSNDLHEYLDRELGARFPSYQIFEFPPYYIDFITESHLTDKDSKILHEALKKVELPIEWRIKTGQITLRSQKSHEATSIHLASSRKLKNEGLSKKLQHIFENDDDFWNEEGKKILAGMSVEESSLGEKQKQIRSTQSSLLNASIFSTDSLHNQVTLYENINVVMPLEKQQDEIFASIGIDESDLVGLAELKKLRILLPYSVNRYNPSTLSAISEANPGSIIGPRQIAAFLIGNSRCHFPFLFPPGNSEMRSQYLKVLLELQKQIGTTLAGLPIGVLISHMKENWTWLEYAYNFRGPLAYKTHGPGSYIGKVFESATGKEHSLEFGYADLGVGIASAFRSTYFPTNNQGWSDNSHSILLAQTYTGGLSSPMSNFQKRLNVVLDGVLSVRKDIPLVELAETMGSGDVARLRRALFDLAYNVSCSDEEISDSVRKLNREIKVIEARQDRLAKWDILGAVSGLTTAKVTDNAMAGVLATFVTNVLKGELPKLRAKFPFAGAMIDSIESIWHRTTPDRILFARIRKDLTSKKR